MGEFASSQGLKNHTGNLPSLPAIGVTLPEIDIRRSRPRYSLGDLGYHFGGKYCPGRIDINYVTVIGFIAAGLVIATLSMRTMVPLRVIGIASNIAFVTYGLLFGSYPTVMLHTILLPLNVYRLREMLNLIKQVKAASKGYIHGLAQAVHEQASDQGRRNPVPQGRRS